MKIGPPLKIRVGVLLREKHPLQQLDSKQGVGLTDDELLVMQLWPQVGKKFVLKIGFTLSKKVRSREVGGHSHVMVAVL